MDFMNKLKNNLDNCSVTENGMKGYQTSGHTLVDMDFKISSYRNMPEAEILQDFKKLIIDESLTNVVKWVFYIRDIRGGNGERRLFKIMIKYLAFLYPTMIKKIIEIIPVYGRWDDLFCLLDTNLKNEVISLIRKNLIQDLKNLENDKPISLLGKWMPSINTSSEKTKKIAQIFIREFNLTPKEYRKMLSALRRKIDVVEKRMSNNEWDLIHYDNIPAGANLIYSNAFYRHDKERRKEYLEGLKTGDRKIKSQNLFPYQIYCKLKQSQSISEKDTLEAMWASKVENDKININSTLVVCDTSGSMTWGYINGTSAKPIDIASSLAIYFSEKNLGVFKDKYITFSREPRFVDLSECISLDSKIKYLERKVINEDTNIEKVFKLVLDTAVKNHLKQEELPKRILIISDMEFNGFKGAWYRTDYKDFEAIKKEFEYFGYHVPKLIFWNVASRTKTIPMKQNDNGISLISGFSEKRLEMIMSEQKDPYDALLEKINSSRYDLVSEKIQAVLN